MYSESFSSETEDERANLAACQGCYGGGSIRFWHDVNEPPRPVQSSSRVMLSMFESPVKAFHAAGNSLRFRLPDRSSPDHISGGDSEFPLYRSSFEKLSMDEHIQSGATEILSSTKSLPSLEVSRSGRQTTLMALSGNPASPETSAKTRIRWTQDLHEKFVECINRLGGAERATPKSILKLMDSDKLTIFHIKSHLQKYRMAKCVPYPAEERLARRNSSVENLPLDSANLQIREALELQLDVQRRLHEQLEIQKNLQVRIEEHGRKLKMMFAQQQNAKQEVSENDEADSLEDVLLAAEDGSQNTQFPEKIS
ncbi:hypothetical protein MLD38_019520 [Melastoma candidum]|uniref:Uncharacterized protein n=1 Tax=Melastoma candidum TaxID=119954 RepID=A0ACB9QX89_9MYRT|nr:hypothetical protein MLD38_019520 [Melastoma candidum]